MIWKFLLCLSAACVLSMATTGLLNPPSPIPVLIGGAFGILGALVSIMWDDLSKKDL
jgi:hypothetical protein